MTEFNIAATTDYFSIITNDGTKLSDARVMGSADGTRVFCAEDIDSPPNTFGAAQSLTTNAVNIAGKINNQVRILVAAPGRPASQVTPPLTPLGQYENFSSAPTAIDFIRIDYSINGGIFQPLAQFAPTTLNVASPLALDNEYPTGTTTNLGDDTVPGDDAVGNLTQNFQDFTFNIPTGNNVQVRVTMHSNATGEYLAVDNIRIFGESAASNPPVLAGVPGTNLVFTEGGAATAIASAITVADTDSANLTTASVSISQNFASGQDLLAATPSGAILAGDIVLIVQPASSPSIGVHL
ncbi:MAG: hypothetical protein HC767_06960 [Akkermansiaceae bacterium]|nr:hypothetical protein [Akkermansiaceae bacterium]